MEQTIDTRRRPLVPPHVFWPGMVVAILLMSVLAQVYLVTSALSDGGVQVEDDYYAHAAHFEDQQKREAASAALGWAGTLTSRSTPEGTVMRLDLVDAAGAPITGVAGTLSARHATRAEGPVVTLEPVEGSPGLYEGPLAFDRPGLWDFSVDVSRGGDRFLYSVRRELAP